MLSRRVLVLLAAVLIGAALVQADIYLHHPRGGNGRVRTTAAHTESTAAEQARALTCTASEREPHSGSTAQLTLSACV